MTLYDRLTKLPCGSFDCQEHRVTVHCSMSTDKSHQFAYTASCNRPGALLRRYLYPFGFLLPEMGQSRRRLCAMERQPSGDRPGVRAWWPIVCCHSKWAGEYFAGAPPRQSIGFGVSFRHSLFAAQNGELFNCVPGCGLIEVVSDKGEVVSRFPLVNRLKGIPTIPKVNNMSHMAAGIGQKRNLDFSPRVFPGSRGVHPSPPVGAMNVFNFREGV